MGPGQKPMRCNDSAEQLRADDTPSLKPKPIKLDD